MPFPSSRRASIGKGVDSGEAVGNSFVEEGGTVVGLSLNDSSKSSGSSSSRLMVVDAYQPLKDLLNLGNKISGDCWPVLRV